MVHQGPRVLCVFCMGNKPLQNGPQNGPQPSQADSRLVAWYGSQCKHCHQDIALRTIALAMSPSTR